MQQTEKFKLNLIETSDTFSPQALNENMEKVEAALGTKADAAQTANTTDALDSRVTAIEARRLIMDVLVGKGESREVDLGFAPKAVIIIYGQGFCRMAVRSDAVLMPMDLSLTDNGFWVSANLNAGAVYYIAFL